MTKTYGLLPKHKSWIEARDAREREFRAYTLRLALQADAALARSIEDGSFRCRPESEEELKLAREGWVRIS